MRPDAHRFIRRPRAGARGIGAPEAEVGRGRGTDSSPPSTGIGTRAEAGFRFDLMRLSTGCSGSTFRKSFRTYDTKGVGRAMTAIEEITVYIRIVCLAA